MGRGLSPPTQSPWALHPPAPPSALALGGPRVAPAPPIICWKVQWRGGRSPCRAPRFGRPVAPASDPSPQRSHTFCSCPVPFCIWKKRVVINPEMDVFSAPPAASFFSLRVGGWGWSWKARLPLTQRAEGRGQGRPGGEQRWTRAGRSEEGGAQGFSCASCGTLTHVLGASEM